MMVDLWDRTTVVLMAALMAGPTDRTMAGPTAVRTVGRKDRSMAVKMAVSMADH